MSNWSNIPNRISKIEEQLGNEDEIKDLITKLEDKVNSLEKLVKKLENTVKDLKSNN